MNREISKGKYFLAAFITLAIFLLGMFLGLVIENKRVGYMQSVTDKQKLEFGSLQLQYRYITELSEEKNCPAILGAFESYMNRLGKSEERLESYSQDASINKDEFIDLKREHVQTEIDSWLLARQVKKICDIKQMDTVLYFYSTEKMCPDCEKQSLVFSYLKSIFKDKLLVFAIDSNLEEEAIIDMLKTTYSINKYPTLIINDKKIEEFAESDKLLIDLCDNYEANETPKICIE